MIRTVAASTRTTADRWYDSFHAAATVLESFGSGHDPVDACRCVAVVSTDLGAWVFEGDPRSTVDAFIHAVERAIVAGGQAFVLGCAVVNADQRVVRTLRVPGGDRMAAAAAMARELVADTQEPIRTAPGRRNRECARGPAIRVW